MSFAIAHLLSGCGDDRNGSALPKEPDIQATDPLSKKIEKFTGGHSKMVWSKHLGQNSPDGFALYDKLELWGVDTRDGQGVRRIVDEVSNYARPLISPSGETIVFSRKGTIKQSGKKEKKFDPRIFRIDWNGENLEELGPGYAVDVWRDPKTKIEWVYVTDLLPTPRASMYASRLERFKLLDPADRETVWDKTRLSTENIQISRDGKRASGLFPWPDAGAMNLEKIEFWKYQTGCWPSLAPDNSYRTWVFDGSHKNIYLFADGGERLGTVPLNQAPGTEGHEVYHPRWSNHVRFFSMTGPYTGKSIGQSKGETVEIFIGKFSEKIDAITDWLQVTNDKTGDFFPDLWIAHAERFAGKGETESSEEPKKKDPPKERRDWPLTSSTLLFAWQNSDALNRLSLKSEDQRTSGVIARDRARFGRNYEMLTDGGYFEADPDSASAVNGYVSRPKTGFTIEVLATPFFDNQDGTILSTGTFQVQQRGTDLVFVTTKPKPTAFWIGTAKAGQPAHIGVIDSEFETFIFHNGKQVSQGDRKPVAEMIAVRPGLTFGEGWDGALEWVAIVPGPLAEYRLEADYEYVQKQTAEREPLPQVRLKGKLLEMTSERSLGDSEYNRALTCYLYEVEEVLEGDFDADKVLVYHWTIMDRKPLQGFPRRPGKSYELLLEPNTDEAHPEIVGEQKWSDLDGYIFNEGLPLYYDVETPKE